MDRQGMLDGEERSWAAFWTEVGRVPEERRANGDALPGWSVHDLVWHCAKWTDFTAEFFESLEPGSFTDPFDAHTDEYWDGVNDDIASESKALPWDEVRAGAERARARARAALIALPDVGEDAARWWSEETFVHYNEHTEHVRTFVDG